MIHNSRVSKKALGTLLVSLSASAFGTYSLFALMAVHAGIGLVPLLFYRFALASLILGLIVLTFKIPLPTWGQLPAIVGLGGLYVGQSFTYLQCLKASNPITASLLLYLYPALVTIASVLFLHEKLTATKIVALACALGGSILIVGPVSQMGTSAVAYGIGTAVFYTAYLVLGKSVLRNVEGLSATLVIITTAAVVYGVSSIFTGLDLPTATSGWAGIVGLSLVATVFAIGGLILGLKWVTPVEASSLSALEPLVTAIIAVLFLSQTLRFGHVAGGLLVITAVLVLARHSTEIEAK